MRKIKLDGQQKEEEYNKKRNENERKSKERVQKSGHQKTQSIVIKLFFGGNLEKLDFPLNCNSKNRPFKKQ